MIALLRTCCEWVIRLEIVFLGLFYLYFVASDRVPLVAFALIALIWIVRWRMTGVLFRRTPFNLPIIVLLLWLPVSYSVTIDPAQSLPKVYGILLCVAAFYAVVNAIKTERDLASATIWLVAASAAIALAGLIGTDWAQGKIVSAQFIYDNLPHFVQSIPRSIAGGFARNGVGGTLALVIPLLAGLVAGRLFSTGVQGLITPTKEPLRNEYWRLNTALVSWSLLLAMILSIVTLILTQSRGGILGTIVGLLVVGVWRERKVLWVMAAGVLGLVVLAAAGHAGQLVDLILRMDGQNGTLASRLEVWERGLMMVRDFPYTGIGIGTFNTVAHLMYPFFIAAPDEIVAHAHNQFLQVAVDMGIPGLLAYVGLLVAFGVCAIRAYRGSQAGIRALVIGLAAGLIAHHVFGLTDAFILGTKPGIAMWIFFGFVAAIDRLARQARFDLRTPASASIRPGGK